MNLFFRKSPSSLPVLLLPGILLTSPGAEAGQTFIRKIFICFHFNAKILAMYDKCLHLLFLMCKKYLYL